MSVDTSRDFIFGDADCVIGEADFVAKLPHGISSKQALLRALAAVLHFPDYFGKNWDALSDVLRDLSWLPDQRVVLVHPDLPTLTASELSTYTSVLAQAVEDWRDRKQQRFTVVFPSEARTQLER